MKVQSYLMFDGRCEEAVEFYKAKIGAKVGMLLRFSDGPKPEPGQPCMNPPGTDNKVMHCDFRVGETDIMASDGMCGGKPEFKGVSLALSVPTEAEAGRLFAALSDGGLVQMPMGKTFFAGAFGMVADKFGVNWMILGNQQK